MPFTIIPVDAGLGLIYQGRGIIAREDILDQKRRAALSPEAARKLRYVLVDHTEVEQICLQGEDIRDLVGEQEFTAAESAGIWFVIVAPNDHVFGISRMWQTLVEKLGWRVYIARTREEGEQWIRERVPGARLADTGERV